MREVTQIRVYTEMGKSEHTGNRQIRLNRQLSKSIVDKSKASAYIKRMKDSGFIVTTRTVSYSVFKEV